jgi:hypothetical protein
MVVRTMLLILGAFHILNGFWMLAAPAIWYAAIPGVAETGSFNPHFITDIALAFVASGTGLILGATTRAWAGPAAVAGAAWPALHGLFHIWIWLSMGFPRALPVALSEALGVVAVGALGALLAWLRINQERIV